MLSHIDFFHDCFFTQLSLFLTELVGHLLLVTLIFIHVIIPSWLGIILDNIIPNIRLLCSSLIWPLSNHLMHSWVDFPPYLWQFMDKQRCKRDRMCLILFILPLAKESLSAKWKWLESKNRIKKKKKGCLQYRCSKLCVVCSWDFPHHWDLKDCEIGCLRGGGGVGRKDRKWCSTLQFHRKEIVH